MMINQEKLPLNIECCGKNKEVVKQGYFVLKDVRKTPQYKCLQLIENHPISYCGRECDHGGCSQVEVYKCKFCDWIWVYDEGCCSSSSWYFFPPDFDFKNTAFYWKIRR